MIRAFKCLTKANTVASVQNAASNFGASSLSAKKEKAVVSGHLLEGVNLRIPASKHVTQLFCCKLETWSEFENPSPTKEGTGCLTLSMPKRGWSWVLQDQRIREVYLDIASSLLCPPRLQIPERTLVMFAVFKRSSSV